MGTDAAATSTTDATATATDNGSESTAATSSESSDTQDFTLEGSATDPGETEDDSDTSIDATLSGGSSSSGGSGCAALDETECGADDTCTEITAQELVEDDTADPPWCAEASAFVGCRDAADACDPPLHACPDAKGPTYLLDEGCIPAGWEACDPPEPDIPDCR